MEGLSKKINKNQLTFFHLFVFYLFTFHGLLHFLNGIIQKLIQTEITLSDNSRIQKTISYLNGKTNNLSIWLLGSFPSVTIVFANGEPSVLPRMALAKHMGAALYSQWKIGDPFSSSSLSPAVPQNNLIFTCESQNENGCWG